MSLGEQDHFLVRLIRESSKMLAAPKNQLCFFFFNELLFLMHHVGLLLPRCVSSFVAKSKERGSLLSAWNAGLKGGQSNKQRGGLLSRDPTPTIRVTP